MCLASRLSTQANLGNMSSKREVLVMVLGNISLVQVQATVAAFLVACFATIIGVIVNKSFSVENSMLLIAASMFTATSSCLVLGNLKKKQIYLYKNNTLTVFHIVPISQFAIKHN